MKLNILPAQHGRLWFRQALTLLKRQPLGLTGISALALTFGMLLSFFPLLGPFLTLILFPTVSLCMMLAAQKVEQGNYPIPSLLSELLRAGSTQKKALLILGVLYALCVTLLLSIIGALSGDIMAEVIKAQTDPQATHALLKNENLLPTAFTIMIGMALISLLFWHAPALVYWHGISPVKSLFFSATACLRNVRAYLVFGLYLAGMYLASGLVVVLIGSISHTLIMLATYSIGLLTGTIVGLATYFAYRDSFFESSPTIEPAPRPPK